MCAALTSHQLAETNIEIALEAFRELVVGWRSPTQAHSSPKVGDGLPDFNNSDAKLKYLRHDDARLEKQCKVKHQHTRVLDKTPHQCGKSLDSLAKS